MTWIPTNQTAEPAPSPRGTRFNTVLEPFRWFAGIVHWCFGMASVILGLAILATIPLVQLLTLGYFLSLHMSPGGR